MIRALTFIVAMKVLQLNITSINNSIKALELYQEQNDYDLITLQETDTQEKDLRFKNWKIKSLTGIKDKKQGYGVVTLIKNDSKNIFRDGKNSDKLECIWNELSINNKRTLMANLYISPNNHHMIDILDYELEQHKYSRLIILGDFNAKHPVWDKKTKKPNQNGKLMADLIDLHNLIIQNDGNNTHCHPNEQSIIDLVLTRSIENVCCSTKKIDLTTTLQNGIEIKIQQNINKDTNGNTKYKMKEANWESWKQSLSDSLDDQFKGIHILNVNDIDNAISLLTKTITDCANLNLGIVKDRKHLKNWWKKELTSTYENHRKLQKKLNYRSAESNERELKKNKKALQKLINNAKGDLEKFQTEYLNSSKDSQKFWHRFNKIQNNKGKNIVEPLQTGQNTYTFSDPEISNILKETHTDRSKSNNNFDDNFKINLENRLKEVINSSDLFTSNNNITIEKVRAAVNKLNNLSAPGQNMYTLN